jgi:5-methylcytosine-specific restriction protein A
MSPTRPLPTCRYPGCPARVPSGFCPEHQSLSPKFANKARGSASQRGYGAAWRHIRAQVLREEPLCVLCSQQTPARTTLATHVDHVVPKAAGGTDERSNLRGLCAAHHSEKTAREAAAFRRGRYGRQGGRG